mgnify:CR=1 FL=1
MSLDSEERKSIVTLEFDKASKTYAMIPTLADNGMWDIVANRLYYSLFHAILALLVNDGHKTSTHGGLIAIFGLHYVKTGIFSVEDGKTLSRLESLREEADYNCAFSTSKEDIEPYIDKVGQLLKSIEAKLTILK